MIKFKTADEGFVDMNDALVIFVKKPEPGRVKTRLTPFLSEERAAALYRLFVEASINIAIDVARQVPSVEIIVAAAPSISDSYFRALEQKFNIALIEQGTGDLEQRLKKVFAGLHDVYGKVVVIGSDSPTLPVQYLTQAFELLDNNDIVIGPTEDGGYYLIGEHSFHPGLFENISWSSEHVFEETVARVDAQLHYATTPCWYDIDLPADLQKIKGTLFEDKFLTDFRMI